MFIALPEQFGLTGRFNTAAIERYYTEEVAAQQGRYRIVIDVASSHSYSAGYDDRDERDKVFGLFDRYLTGRDKVPQFDALEGME